MFRDSPGTRPRKERKKIRIEPPALIRRNFVSALGAILFALPVAGFFDGRFCEFVNCVLAGDWAEDKGRKNCQQSGDSARNGRKSSAGRVAVEPEPSPPQQGSQRKTESAMAQTILRLQSAH